MDFSNIHYNRLGRAVVGISKSNRGPFKSNPFEGAFGIALRVSIAVGDGQDIEGTDQGPSAAAGLGEPRIPSGRDIGSIKDGPSRGLGFGRAFEASARGMGPLGPPAAQHER